MFGPPLITRTLVATNSPTPASNPMAMPQARPFSRRMATCAAWSGPVIGDAPALDMVKKIPRRAQLGTSPGNEHRDRDHQIATERHEPAGSKAGDKPPG